jgi:hypothetical protein
MNRFQNIPTLGKLYLAASVALSLIVFSNSVDPYNLSYTFKQTFFELGLWRPITGILYLSKLGFLLPFHLIFAVVAFSKGAGRMFGDRDKSGLLWIFLLSTIALSIFSTFTGLYFFGSSFIMIVFMMWAIQHPTDHIFLFNFAINSIYFPIIYAATMILLGSSFKHYMAGFLIGLLFGFIKNPTFIDKNGDIFPCPSFIKTYFQEDNRSLILER